MVLNTADTMLYPVLLWHPDLSAVNMTQIGDAWVSLQVCFQQACSYRMYIPVCSLILSILQCILHNIWLLHIIGIFRCFYNTYTLMVRNQLWLDLNLRLLEGNSSCKWGSPITHSHIWQTWMEFCCRPDTILHQILVNQNDSFPSDKK
jgi:hypothetical protein